MSDIQREIEKFSYELAKDERIETSIIKTLEKVEQRCIDNAMDNDDRYVDCMRKAIKKVEKEEVRFQHRIEFAHHQLHKCLLRQQESGSKDYEKCQKEGHLSVSKYVEDFIKNSQN